MTQKAKSESVAQHLAEKWEATQKESCEENCRSHHTYDEIYSCQTHMSLQAAYLRGFSDCVAEGERSSLALRLPNKYNNEGFEIIAIVKLLDLKKLLGDL